jgi:hypothetical protein
MYSIISSAVFVSINILFELKYLVSALVFVFHVHKFPFVSCHMYFLEYCKSEVQVVNKRKHMQNTML